MNKEHYPKSLAAYKNHRGVINATVLAFVFGHNSETNTTLISTEIDGEEYRLQLSGDVSLHPTPMQIVRSQNGFDNAVEVMKKLIPLDSKPLEQLLKKMEIHNGSWFEWIDSNDEPVFDAFGDISSNPQKEIAKIKDYMGQLSHSMR